MAGDTTRVDDYPTHANTFRGKKGPSGTVTSVNTSQTPSRPVLRKARQIVNTSPRRGRRIEKVVERHGLTCQQTRENALDPIERPRAPFAAAASTTKADRVTVAEFVDGAPAAQPFLTKHDAGRVVERGRRQAEGGAAAEQARSAAPLGNSASNSGELTARQDKRHARSALRLVAAQASGAQWLRDCGRKSVSAGGAVAVKAGGGVAGYSGVATCGSVHACPVCAAKIGAVRADELAQAIQWAKDASHVTALLTLTGRHHAGEPLAAVWARIQGAWEFITDGWGSESEAAYAKRETKHEAAWADHRAGLRRRPRALSPRRVGPKERGGVLHWARAVEATHGEHGWHVHLHVLMILDGAKVPAGLDAATRHVMRLEDDLFTLWEKGLVKHGGTVERDPGADLRILHGDVKTTLSQYLTKAGEALSSQARGMAAEVTLGQFKKGRKTGNATPFELVARVAEDGDADAADRWAEWVEVSRGKKALTWSQGFRDSAGMAKERDDAEIAAEDEGDAVQMMLPRETWLAIRDRLDLRCGLLDAMERGGVEAAGALLDAYALPWSRWTLDEDAAA